MNRDAKPYRIAAIFDTETTNLNRNDNEIVEHVAFPMLYILNRLDGVSDYIPDISDDISMYRRSSDMIEAIGRIIDDGMNGGFIPVICAYNLMFDLQSLLYELACRYDMRGNAQNRVTAYTIDLLDDSDDVVLRFWDTFFLEMNGLAAMGRTCGFAKAEGDWDYDLIRTHETPLTDLEIEYAKRDVQVIPAYLKWILQTNPHLDESDLGFRVLTKTSLVRQMARKIIAPLKFVKENGKRMTLQRAFECTCEQELPEDYESYAMRKACFRGGFTFTSAEFALKPVRNVASIDVVSMHHSFINGRYVPVRFWRSSREILDNLAYALTTYDLQSVLDEYHKPFPFAFHALFRIENIRLRKDSPFERLGIGLLAASKFANGIYSDDDASESTANIAAENAIRDRYRDIAVNPTFAFGKLYSADSIDVHVNELELWNMMQVYEWESITALKGEATFKFIIPPDYVTLQSNMLFELKSAMKDVCKHYTEGKRYERDISELLPQSIRNGIRTGELTNDFGESYYTSTIKGQFNGIYGTQAQDIFKPGFTMQGGYLDVDETTLPNDDNFDSLKPSKPMVLYTYGERIVAGSRMHLVIAIMLLDSLKDRIDILAGDTDSLKIRCNLDIADVDLLEPLKPLHDSVDIAIAKTQARVRRDFPQYASSLDSIGHFEIENPGDYYDWHMEAWNMARISYDDRAHITCAGLSRPYGKYNIEDYANDMIDRFGFEIAAPMILNFNNWIRPELSHSLGHSIPPIDRRIDGLVTDYMGIKSYVDEYAAIALYPIGRMLGSSRNKGNRWTMQYIGDRMEYDSIAVLGYQNDEPYYMRL